MCAELLGAKDWAAREFGGAELGDARRTRRLVNLAGEIALAPGRSLPEATGTWAELKAAYRLVENDAVSFEQVIGPHWRRTRAVCLAGGEFLIVEDTDVPVLRRARGGRGPRVPRRGRRERALAPQRARAQDRTVDARRRARGDRGRLARAEAVGASGRKCRRREVAEDMARARIGTVGRRARRGRPPGRAMPLCVRRRPRGRHLPRLRVLPDAERRLDREGVVS